MQFFLIYDAEDNILIIFLAEFEVGLRMRAYGAHLGRGLAYVDMSAVTADPYVFVHF